MEENKHAVIPGQLYDYYDFLGQGVKDSKKTAIRENSEKITENSFSDKEHSASNRIRDKSMDLI